MNNPTEYFEFLCTEDERKQLILDFAAHKYLKKTDKINPDWLEDSFVIQEFKGNANLAYGVTRMYPVDDLYLWDKQTCTLIRNIPKHVVVRLEFGAML